MARGLTVRVSDEPARFGSVLLRASTDLDAAEVVVYREGLEDLEGALARNVGSLPPVFSRLFQVEKQPHGVGDRPADLRVLHDPVTPPQARPGDRLHLVGHYQ